MKKGSWILFILVMLAVLCSCAAKADPSMLSFSCSPDFDGVYLHTSFPAANDAMVLYEASAGDVSAINYNYTDAFFVTKANEQEDAAPIYWSLRDEKNEVVYLRAIFFRDQQKQSTCQSAVSGEILGYGVIRMTRQSDGSYQPAVLDAQECTGAWHPSESDTRARIKKVIEKDGGNSDFPLMENVSNGSAKQPS